MTEQPSSQPPASQGDEAAEGALSQAPQAVSSSAEVETSGWRRFVGALPAPLQWRGPDGEGPPLWSWLLVLLGGCLFGEIFSVFEPLLRVIPLVVSLGVGLPALLSLRASLHRSPTSRSLLSFAEPFIVGGIFANVGWLVFSYIIRDKVNIEAHDHHVMMARAHEFTARLLTGEIPHYTHYVQGGDSLVDVYPSFANLIATLIHVLSPKGTPFERAYTYMVLFTWWLRGMAVYHVCRRFSGPPISLLIALVSLFEIGQDVWDGVWCGAFYWGMIHNNLALTLGLFATASQIDLIRHVSAKGVISVVALTLLACVAHPLGIFYAVAMTACLCVTLLLARGRRRRIVYALLASIAGLLVASIWTIPFGYALEHYGFAFALPGVELANAGRGLFDGSAPVSTFPAFIMLGAVAVFSAILSGSSAVVLPAIAVLMFWLLSVTPLLNEMRLLALAPQLLETQPRRMLTVLKTPITPVAAWLAVRLFGHLKKPGSMRVGRVLTRSMILGVLLLGPVRALVASADGLVAMMREQIPSVERRGSTSRMNSNPDVERVIEWLHLRRQDDKSASLWRAAIFYPAISEQTHFTFWGDGYRIGVPIVDFYWISANLLSFRPRELTNVGLADWNIRYVITLGTTPPQHVTNLVEVFSSGHYKVYELADFDARMVLAPPGAQVSDLFVDGDIIQFKLSGMPAQGGDVQVRTAWLPRWRGTLNGERVTVEGRLPRVNARAKQEQVWVTGAHDGVVKLRCDGPMPRLGLGALVSVIGVGLTAIIAAPGLRLRAEALLRARYAWLKASAIAAWLRLRVRLVVRRKLVTRALVATATLLVLFALSRGSQRLVIAPMFSLTQGLSVLARVGDGPITSCSASFWHIGYVCRAPGGSGRVMQVETGLGADGKVDDSNEFRRLWPAIRVRSMKKGAIAELRFSRVEAHRALVIKAQSNGSARIGSKFRGRFLGARQITGTETFELPIAPGSHGVGDLQLYVEPLNENGFVQISAHTD